MEPRTFAPAFGPEPSFKHSAPKPGPHLRLTCLSRRSTNKYGRRVSIDAQRLAAQHNARLEARQAAFCR